MQKPQQSRSGFLTSAYNSLNRGTGFFVHLFGSPEKKRKAYDWEERLAYVGEDVEVEIEDDEINGDEYDMQLERSCGVARCRD